MQDWNKATIAIGAVGEVIHSLDRAGLVTVIVVSIIAIAAFVWIFKETGRRD